MGEPWGRDSKQTQLILSGVVTLTSEKALTGFTFGKDSHCSQCFLRAQAKGKNVVKYKD